jgi:arginase
MNNDSNKNVTLIGIPIDLGAENLGVDIGPEAFRHQKIVDKLTGAGLNIQDAGNITVKDRSTIDVGDSRLRYLNEIVRVSKEAAKLTESTIKEGGRVVALGGDHSLNLGVVSGASVALNGDIGLIYLDAHGDMNTPEITLSGNIHGMHLASLMGYGAPELAHVLSEDVKIQKDNLLHIGGSDFDKAELDFIKAENIDCFTLFDLLSQGLGALLPKIDALASKVKNIWVSVDLDVIDRMYAPGAGMPNPAGLNYREIAMLTEYIGQKCNVVGLDVVEYNPLQDVDHKTAELGIELIAKLLGKNYSWYTNYMYKNRI